MCADELSSFNDFGATSSSTELGVRSPTHPGDTSSSFTYPGVRSSTDPGAVSSSIDPGTRPSVDHGARSPFDPGLLAGVAVIVIVLVLAAVCIVALIIWWR